MIGYTQKAVTPLPSDPALHPGQVGSGRDALVAFYDLSISPISFDFITFVNLAEHERLAQGLTSLHIVFVPAPGDGFRAHDAWDNDYDLDQKHWRLFNLCLPISWLAPSCRQLSLCASRDYARRFQETLAGAVYPADYRVSKPVHGWDKGNIVREALCGKEVQHLTCTGQARRFMRTWIGARAQGRPCVTLTLREATYFPKRNAKFPVWARFAQKLAAQGYFPVMMRDAETVFKSTPDEFSDVPMFPEAISSLELRAALYEEAMASVFVANGPSELCAYNRNTPYLYFVTGNWLTERPTPYQSVGIGFQRTPPFAHEFQHWIWREHDEDVLMEELERLAAQLEQGRADGSWEARCAPAPGNREPLMTVLKRFMKRSRWDNVILMCRYALGEALCQAALDGDESDKLNSLSPQETEFLFFLVSANVQKILSADSTDIVLARRMMSIAQRYCDKGRVYQIEMSRLFWGLGEALRGIGDFEEALAMGEKALLMAPDNYSARAMGYYIRAEIEFAAGRRREGLALYYQGLEHGKSETHNLIALCKILEENGWFDDAIDAYIKLITEYGSHREIFYQRLVELLVAAGRTSEALKYRTMFQHQMMFGTNIK